MLVLWVLMLLGGLAAGQAGIGRSAARDARAAEAMARLRVAAEAGIPLGIARIRAARARSDDPQGSLSCRFHEMTLVVAVQDEEGKLDLNSVGPAVVTALLGELGVARDRAAALAGAIADFTDPNDLTRLPGAEAAAYRAAGLPAGPRNAAMAARDEVFRVPGAEALADLPLFDHVTVHTSRRSVAPEAAGTAVLAAIAALGPVEDAFAPSSRTTFRILVTAHADSGAEARREAILRLAPGEAPRLLEWRIPPDPAPPPPAGVTAPC